MATKKVRNPNWILAKLSRINFAFLGVFTVFTIIFDGGNVITREGIYRRWEFAAILLVIFTLFWVAVKKANSKNIVIVALLSCVFAELALAGYMTYWERGMASMSTVLYLMPIASIALLKSRTYTIGTALFASATYMFASTKYFYDFFNEGYRVQLYGEIFFYAGIFLVIGWVIASLAYESK